MIPTSDLSQIPESSAHDESAGNTLFHFGALVLESRRKVAALAISGALAALLMVMLMGPRYSANASFMPQSGGGSEIAALMGIAGQFGIPLPSASSAPPPELYAALVSSPAVLDVVGRELYPLDSAPGSTPVRLAQLFEIDEESPRRRHELVVGELEELVNASVDRRTGVIGLRVRTRWPLVSQRIAERILKEVNRFNLEQRQSQAKAERVFTEERVLEARDRLRAAENAARDFAVRNRVVVESPGLQLEAERLDRAVSSSQQLLTSLEQSLESAKLREVQDTPVITVFQEPTVLSVPDPRGFIKWTVLGAIFGLLLSAVILPVQAFLGMAHDTQSVEAHRFRVALKDTKRQLLGPFARDTKS